MTLTPTELLDLNILACHPSEPQVLRDLFNRAMAVMQGADVDASLHLIVAVRRLGSPALIDLIWERIHRQLASNDRAQQGAAQRLHFLLGDRFLGGLPQERPLTLLVAALAMPEATTRLRAVKALGAMGGEAREAVSLLRPLVADPDLTVRVATVAALRAIMGRTVEEPLVGK